GQQLSAAAAGHHHGALVAAEALVAAHADEAAQAPAAAGDQFADQPALGAQRDAVAGVLDVAPAHQATVVGEGGGTHPEARVRGVGALRDLARRAEQLVELGAGRPPHGAFTHAHALDGLTA